jgi:HprK-related kinase A
MTVQTIDALGHGPLLQHLRHGRLYLHLGPFVTRLMSRNGYVADHLARMYGACHVSTGDEELADFSLRLDAPRRLRRYVRRQVVPDPGFHFPAAPLPYHMASLATEMGLNLCVALQCFRFAIFHAGVVAHGSDGILISARSGGGKSTLTAALMEDGYRLLSDEFAILDPESRMLRAYPRPVSLKNASVDVVRALAGEAEVSPRLVGTPKGDIAYRRPRTADVAAQQTQAVPRLILFPEYQAGAPAQHERLEAAEAAMQLISGPPNYQVLGEPAFQALMTMMEGARTYRLTYGNTADSLALVRDLMGERAP